MVLTDQFKKPGLLTSTRAEKVLTFLESCAGASEDALALIFPHFQQSLRILRGAGYALRCWKRDQEVFWCPLGKPLPTDETYEARCALGWLAARLVECGAELKGREAVFKDGQRLRVYVVPPVLQNREGIGLAVVMNRNALLPKGWFYVNIQDLYYKRLTDCLKKM